MENTTKSFLESCSKLTMEELEPLSLTRIVKERDGQTDFIGLGILDKDGYLLEYDELKMIYSGLHYFLRNINPELIEKMNENKYKEDQVAKQKDQLIDIVSKNIVEKGEDEEQEDEETSFFQRFLRFFKGD